MLLKIHALEDYKQDSSWNVAYFFPLGKSGIAEPTLLPKGHVAEAGGGVSLPFKQIFLMPRPSAIFIFCPRILQAFKYVVFAF